MAFTDRINLFQVLAYVSRVHGVELPEELVDHDNLTLEQVKCRTNSFGQYVN